MSSSVAFLWTIFEIVLRQIYFTFYVIMLQRLLTTHVRLLFTFMLHSVVWQ